ncbi:ATP-binding protein [Brevibacillus agri]|nr:ATP-binding protein [Brevibacillus agri]
MLGKLNQANERKIELKIDPDSNFRDIPAAIDRAQLIVILGNLLDNAMDAVLSPGAFAQEVTIFLLDMEEVLLIEVEDRGPGISRENAERVFELGFRPKRNRITATACIWCNRRSRSCTAILRIQAIRRAERFLP